MPPVAIGPSRATPEDGSEMLKSKFPRGIALFPTSAAHGSSFLCVCADLPCSRTRSRGVHYHPGKSEHSSRPPLQFPEPRSRKSAPLLLAELVRDWKGNATSKSHVSAEICQGDHADGKGKLLSVRKQNCCDKYANVSISRGAKENDLWVKSDRNTAGVTESGKYNKLQSFSRSIQLF